MTKAASASTFLLVAAVVYVPALAFAKFGLVILYHRSMNKKSAVVGGYSIAIIFALIFTCNPIQRSWSSSITGGSRIDRNGLYIATAVTNIITDLALIVIPIPLLCGLHMPRMQKIGLLAIFAIGCA
ncbi:hypothetical protein N7481_009267 [Penicillium waksmanii]|uniref:uncharacterized protein n=1 Tax=Penicillium waksmanii TaxID=69791 RepID=UPI002549A80E|nr:uncharacterized protein N7481_009267 [Penicillium waksmanii]KAJ5975560.1 hypothetical protein N7481_009267 [Penicillium waksmanii]